MPFAMSTAGGSFADIHTQSSIWELGLIPGFCRTLHERLLLDKNLWSQCAGQIRSFLSQALPTPESLKNLVLQTLGKTRLDFVTFLAEFGQVEIGARRGIKHFGLFAAIEGGAASRHHAAGGAIKDGPKLPLVDPARCCGAARRSGHSLNVQNWTHCPESF